MAETDEFYRAIQPPGLDEDQRRVQRQAYAGLLWTKQFYHYSVELWLDGDPAGPEPPPAAAQGRNAELATRLQPRRLERARQVGVSLVCRLGHRVSLHRAGPARPGVGQAAGGALAPRVVHAPERPAPGLRVGLFGRQSAGARPGRPAGLRDHARPDRRSGHRSSSRRSFTSCCSTSPGGSTARTPRDATPFRGASSAWTTSACSTAAGPTWARADGSSRPTGPPGWGCFASTCWRSRSSFLTPGRPTRRSPPSFSSTSWPSRTPSTGFAARSACGTRIDGFYYDVVRVKGGPPEHLKVRSFVGLIPLFASLAIEPGTLEHLPHFRRRVEWYIRYRSDAGRQPLPDD